MICIKLQYPVLVCIRSTRCVLVHSCSALILPAGRQGMSQILPWTYMTTLAFAATTLGLSGVTCFEHKSMLTTGLRLEVVCSLEQWLRELTVNIFHVTCFQNSSQKVQLQICLQIHKRVLAQRILCENLPSRYNY